MIENLIQTDRIDITLRKTLPNKLSTAARYLVLVYYKDRESI